MFCPRCATENKKEQRYCRQCGLTLTSIRLALDGRVDEAIQKYKKSENTLAWGFFILLIGGLNAGINSYFHAWPVAIIAAIIGFVVGMTLILTGVRRMGQASKILNPAEKKLEPDPLLAIQTERANSALPAAPVTEELLTPQAPPPSVVENTTIKLKR